MKFLRRQMHIFIVSTVTLSLWSSQAFVLAPCSAFKKDEPPEQAAKPISQPAQATAAKYASGEEPGGEEAPPPYQSGGQQVSYAPPAMQVEQVSVVPPQAVFYQVQPPQPMYYQTPAEPIYNAQQMVMVESMAPPLIWQFPAQLNGYEVTADKRVSYKEQFEQKLHQLKCRETRENSTLDGLRELKRVIIVDRSGSMGLDDNYPLDDYKSPAVNMFGQKNWTRWDSALMITKFLAEGIHEMSNHQEIPVILFSDHADKIIVAKNGQDLVNSFTGKEPGGGTNLGGALETAFNIEGIDRTKDKVLYIVITDGEPDKLANGKSHETWVHDLIHENLTTLDPGGDRLNIVFVQIGDNKDATRFLKRLDSDKIFQYTSGGKTYVKIADPEKRIGQNVDTKKDNVVYSMGPATFILNSIFEVDDNAFRSGTEDLGDDEDKNEVIIK